MAVRTKVLVLLSGLMLFLAAAAGVALGVRARAAAGLERVAASDVPLLALATDVMSAHIEQTHRLERVLHDAQDHSESARAADSYEKARSEYEEFAAAIWLRLQEADGAAQQASGGAAADLQDRVRRLDAANNAYAERVRATLDLLAEGRTQAAVESMPTVSAANEHLEHTLGSLLGEAAASAKLATARASRDERFAAAVLGGLLVTSLALAAAVFITVVRLVSTVRALSGLLPICAHCKKIRDDGGYWNRLEAYVEAHSEAEFTHGMCHDCQEAMRARTLAARGVAAAG